MVEVGLRAACAVDGSDVAGTARPVNLCGRLSLLETAEVIRRAALFVGVDSGPAHLANAVGTPGVVLLGRYRGFDAYVPYSGGYADGSNATLVRADGPAATIDPAAVARAVRAELARARGPAPTGAAADVRDQQVRSSPGSKITSPSV